ncbi:hypothetical protein CC1G_00413 [Coprinopsis cinerea okayama7|uniref:Uncharacterized protein n=1 Tax=Coprinopsis cinerea (strain Okayama-7 / 130 / ATCC MYA-4618 / FGSC 9003) TaxID=240176 RepID=A8NXV3_COPC7|nr:hypothetical protein CC1G_00413 [Coprinopsis cinerea okayama7\|eukprot:XP_001837277.1 hypothetical protein CC1G_00413 [Coprinopsis cinerea okayama7\
MEVSPDAASISEARNRFMRKTVRKPHLDRANSANSAKRALIGPLAAKARAVGDATLDLALMKSIPLFLAALSALAQASQIQLHHRVLHPEATEAAWTEHGSLTYTDGHPQLQSQQASTFSKLLEPVKDLDNALYQVALQRDGSQVESEWAVSSVKLCHLAAATSQILHLHVSSDGKPYALDYFVSPIPHDGACPTPLPIPSSFATVSRLNTTILLGRPSSPPSPELRTPPPLTPEGQVVQPVPEKTFMQKYWLYITLGLIALVLVGPEEPPAEGQAPASR